jgi:hypothetical protein
MQWHAPPESKSHHFMAARPTDKLKEKAMTNGARVKIGGQARRRFKERLERAFYMAHGENTDRVEGPPRRYKLGIDIYIPPGSWDAMTEAAIDFFETWAPAAKAVGQNGAGSESVLKIRGQARRRFKERLAVVVYTAHRENADRVEGATRGFKLGTDVHIPPAWHAMAEAAIDIFESEMGKRLVALVGDPHACAKGYRAAGEIVSPRRSWAQAAKAVGQNGAGSESLRVRRYGTTSRRARELLLELLDEIDNTRADGRFLDP